MKPKSSMSQEGFRSNNEVFRIENTKNKELLNVNINKALGLLTEAKTICSREYKGFGSSLQTQNGVLESEVEP